MPPARTHPLLTPREQEGLDLVAEGLADKQIADRMCISENTLHWHLKSAYRKRGITSRTELVCAQCPNKIRLLAILAANRRDSRCTCANCRPIRREPREWRLLPL